MFIGLAINQSKTLLSIHLTAQKLPYYERIFLRSILAARVGFKKNNDAMRKECVVSKPTRWTSILRGRSLVAQVLLRCGNDAQGTVLGDEPDLSRDMT